MALAVNRIKELGGGTVVCLNGDFLAELAFPIGSLISEESMEALADRLKLVQEISRQAGLHLGRYPDHPFGFNYTGHTLPADLRVRAI